MKRSVAVILFGLGFALVAQAEAGRLPRAESMIDRVGLFHPTHATKPRHLPAAPRMVERIGVFRPTHSVREPGR